MLDILAGSPLLTVFLVVALGTLVGSIPFGPIRFGPAGGLFVGLAVGAMDERLGQGLGLMQTLGLALFVYTVGLAGGYQLASTFRRQLPTMLAGLLVLVATAGVAIGGGQVLGLSAPMTAGAFSGSLTATAALAAATEAAGGSGDPAVGYSLGYPVGVTLSIFVLAVLVSRRWPAHRDPAPEGGRGLQALSVDVEREVGVDEVPGWREQRVTMSYLVRDGHGRVVTDDDRLLPGDRVLVIGAEQAGREALQFLGLESSERLTDDRTDLDHRRFTVSNHDVAGRTVADLDLPRRHGGRATRVYRGDTEFLARDDFVLELGDRVLAVFPQGRLEVGASIFGDSERRVSEVDALTLAVGLALGLLLGIVPIPLGVVTLTLGAAAGPLLVGLLLGRLVRTGPLVWSLPNSANLTLRQLGLFLFLACVGLASGPAFARTVLTTTGLQAAALGGTVTLAACLFTWLAGRLLQLSAPRTAGIMSGIIGQPAVLAFAQSKSDDPRIESSYTSLFAVGTVVKILLAYLLAVLW
ncbi:aspartate:alanine exchanger family transporter [Aestuariimicrobium ganziense]|uniref:aspartate:alanine exchanger family transporter n=1 Tax=Aestuariimicrobium ganziense TaxID=2773677 RepID=UPI00194317EC|nr:TrkA C-terminal domain-containing protein [Aestuariimicrobium ganziense]